MSTPQGRPPKGVPEQLPLPRNQVVLIGTGAFAVSMLPSWTLLLRRWYGWSIRPCLTHAATAMVAPAALAAAANSPVWGPDWPTAEGMVPHRELAGWADLVLVAPATANFIGKCANGIADSLALNVVLSASCPVFLLPSLSETAFGRPSVQRNLALLVEDGHHMVPTVVGVSVHSGRAEQGGMADIGATLRLLGSVLNPPELPVHHMANGTAVAATPSGEEGTR